MNALGEISLSVAVLLCAATVMAALFAVRFQSSWMLLLARWITAGVAVLFTMASAALVISFVKNDFSLNYVAHYSERALPVGFKLAAFWAGQEGSLLLWALLLSIMSAVAVCTLNRFQSIAQSAAVIVTLAVVCSFFGLLLLFAADPFATIANVPADGNGLNPALQDLGMIAHPPMLFFGYAGFTIPFALMIGALVTRQRDDHWVGAARVWALVAWLFLTIGIVLGAKWAYTTLGWGGYWGWDPVENASLLPWLTGTALLHSLMVQKHRGMFRIWNAGLLASTFILCIFGTYITRSGLVDSVHGFGQSLVGTFFLVFLLTSVLFSIGLIAWRNKTLRSNHKLGGLLGREGAFLAANVLLCGITAVVLIGTIFPAITGAITGTRTTLGAGFYNKVFGPVAMVLVALMSTGPLQGYGKEAANRLKKGLIVPALLALIAAAGIWFAGLHDAWAVVCGAIAVAALAAVVIDLARLVIKQSKHENPLLALYRLLNSNRRRYGAQLAHLGVVLVLIGVIGSSVFSTKQTFQLNPDTTVDFGGMHLTLNKVAENQGPNYSAIEATITAIDAAGRSITLSPQRRFYDKWEDQPASVVAIQSSWKQDIYVNLAGWDGGGKSVAIQVIVNPLVSWLWIGSWVVAAGGLVCLIPRFNLFPVQNTGEITMKPMKSALATTVAAVACAFVLPLIFTASASAQATPPALPPGHPDLSQLQPQDPGALPPGHPQIGGGTGATTQPSFNGEIKVRAVQTTPGGPAIGAEPVTVELYSRGELLDTSTTKLAADGTLKVNGLPIKFGLQAVVKVAHAGVTFTASSDVVDVEHASQSLDIPVYETTTKLPEWSVKMRHVMIHPNAAGLDVTEMLAVSTTGDRAWTGNADKTTLILPLAAGAKDLKVAGGLSPSDVQLVDGKLVSKQPLLPGEERYQLEYTIPAPGGEANLAITAPISVGHVLVFLPDDGTTITTNGLQAMGSQQMGEGGAKTRYYMATSLEAGKTVSLTVSGLKTTAAVEPTTRAAVSDQPADEPAAASAAPVEATTISATFPKAIAVIGALGMLFAGGLVLLVKKAPAAVKVPVQSKSNKGRGNAGR